MTHFKRPVAAAVSALLAGVCFSSVALAAPSIDRSHAPRVGQSLDAAAGPVHVFVRLEEQSVASFSLKEMARSGTMPDSAAQRAQAARVDAAKAGIRASLSGLGAEEFMDLRVGDAGIGVTVDARYLSALRSLPGVREVAKVELVKPSNANSVPWINAPEVWETYGFTGKGVSVGIIDTGIDYHHTDFGGDEDYASNPDPSVIEPGTFPTMKVVGGYDFAGICDVGTAGNPACGGVFNVEDPDPLDFGLGSVTHGSHVAGTAGGIGNDDIGPGVAFEADLYAIKVFGDYVGSTTLTAAGIEWAMDPNGDGDMSDRLDVINMSLGSDLGDPTSPSAVTSNAAADVGVIVVSSAGNAADVPYNLGSPAVASQVIAVAASTTGGLEYAGVEITEGAAAGTFAGNESAFDPPNPRLADTGPVSGSIVAVEPFEGCTELTNPEEVAGNIALVSRGSCAFIDKHLTAVAAGASAVIVYNNQGNGLINMAGDGTGVDIPSIFIGQDDGTAIAAALEAEAVSGTLATGFIIPEFDDNIANFSSRGPGQGGSTCKPEITAPGVAVVSANGQTGSGPLTLSGTSMAAPHIAGVAALLREQHPDADQSVIKSILMGSTVPAQSPTGAMIPITLQGTGVIRADLAAKATAYADPGCVSFGRLNPAVAESRDAQVRIKMLEKSPGRTLTVENIPNQTVPGVEVICRSKSVTVNSRGNQAVLGLKITLDPSQMDPDFDYFSHTEVDGWCKVSDAVDEIAVAYTATVDPASDIRAWERRPGQGRVANRGQTFGYAEAFDVAGSGDEGASGTPYAIDTLGVRTEDYGFPALEFGISTQAPWETMSNYDILMSIDADEDGIYETTLEAVDLGLLTGPDPTGEIVTLIFNDAGGFILFDVFGDFNDRSAVLTFCENDCFGAPLGVLPVGDKDFDYVLEIFDVRSGESGFQVGSIDLAAGGNTAPSFVVVGPGDKAKLEYAPGSDVVVLSPTNKAPNQVRFVR